MAEQNKKPSVIQALRQFMPAFLAASPPLRQEQRRAIWALENCRTATLGGSAHRCADCGTYGYAYHSCNNKGN
jgi:Transposase zinc-binding domain